MAPDSSKAGTHKLSLNRNQADRSFAQKRFKGCRWHVDEQGLEYCSNRDVMPYAGKTGFTPESWCPDCTLFKPRRNTKKRSGLGNEYI